MRLFARVGLISAALASLPLACSSDDGGSSAEEFAARYCALFQPCCEDAGIAGDQAGCKQFFSLIGSNNGAAAEDCIRQYEEMAKAADWCQTYSTAPQPESCKRAFPQGGGSGGGGGTKQPGAVCDTDDECSAPANGEARCDYDFDTETSHCQRLNFVAVGEACVGTRDENLTVISGNTSGQYELGICNRADGSYCDNGTCANLAPVGGACSDSLGCEGDSVYCRDTCKNKVPPGQSCADSYTACDDSGYCDSFGTETCLATKPNGQACDSSTECQSHYCDLDVCDDNPGAGALGLLFLCQ